MFTIIELAEKLKVHPVTIRRYVQNNKIPYLKVGKSVRFTQEHVDEFIESCSMNSKPNDGENGVTDVI